MAVQPAARQARSQTDSSELGAFEHAQLVCPTCVSLLLPSLPALAPPLFIALAIACPLAFGGSTFRHSMQHTSCRSALSARPAVARLPRRGLAPCSRPMLAVRCSVAGAAGQPPVANPIVRLAGAAASWLQAAKQRAAASMAEAVRQTDEQVRRLRSCYRLQHRTYAYDQ